MRNLLIIYPHWIPSNLVGVQRARLIGNYLVQFGWKPIVLTVDPSFYEEPLVPELLKTVSDDIKVEFVEALPINKKIRFFGDIALRGFFPLIKGALNIIKREQIDFIWTPIPSFYSALIARRVHDLTGINYGIDYMDPWVHDFPGSNKLFSRAWVAKKLAEILEPIAIKKATLITGVSTLSYQSVIDRNPALANVNHCSMELGYDPNDYSILPDNPNLLWDKDENILPIIYAGAFLPKSHYYIDRLFKTISDLRMTSKWEENIRFYFIGTGRGKLSSISDYAKKYNVQDIVKEFPDRISYLEVLHHLSSAYGVLAIGNTEPHYTASKIFQVILSKKPILALFHENSTVVQILEEANADNYLIKYNPKDESSFDKELSLKLSQFIHHQNSNWAPIYNSLNKYSSKESARKLVEGINKSYRL